MAVADSDLNDRTALDLKAEEESGKTKIITDTVETANDTVSPEIDKAVEKAIEENNTPPAGAVGTVVKSVLTDESRQETAAKTEQVKKSIDENHTPVSVGDTFKDTKTGNTITVVKRDAENTTVEIDTGSKTETRKFTNSQANNLATDEQFERVETSEPLSPEEAQKYNIVVSNLKRKADELGLLDNNFFTDLQDVDLYSPTASDRALISSEFRRVFANNTDPLITDWLNAIGVDVQSVTNVSEDAESRIKKAGFVTGTTESEKITVDMDDETRAELLNKKRVNVVSIDAENTKALNNIDLDALQNSYPSYARPIIKKIARDFGILNEPFFNPDIELEFSYSGDSIQESINKQHSRYGDFVKMLSVFSDVIENAVGVETHKDKYTRTRREDTNLKQMYVLASAFSDEKSVYPVKLEVKEFKKNTNKLYLSVVLTKKESRYLSGNLGQNQLNTAPPTSIISISDLVSIVNPSEGDFLKYFPDSMLDSEQIEGKNKALAKDAEKIEKLKAPLNNNPETANAGEILNISTLKSTPKSNFGKVTPAQIDALRKVSRALGVNIVLENDAEGYDGYYDSSTRTIHINANSVKPIDTVVRHEIIHLMKREAPREFLVFRDFIKQKYIEQYGQDALDTYVKNKKAQYKQKENRDISDDVAYEELCADIGMDMLSTASHVREFVIKHRNPARKLYEYTKRVIHTLGRVFGIDNIDNYSVYEAYIELAKATGDKASIEVDERANVKRTYDIGFTEETAEAFSSLPNQISLKSFAEGSRLLGLALDSLENARRNVQGKHRDIANSHMSLDDKKIAFSRVLDNSLKSEMDSRDQREFSFENSDITIDPATIEDIFSVSYEAAQNFSDQIDSWLSGKMKSSDLFEIGDTPEVLKALGASKLPVVMSQDVMAKITGEKHSISLDEIKQLPYAIADPIMVFKSATVDNAYIILTELIDKSGNDVVVAMHLNRMAGFNKINRISSVYGKYNINNFVSAQINAGNLKYADINKSQGWLRSRGLQLPKLNTILGSTDSILQKEDIVNRYYAENEKKYANDSTDNDTLFSFSKVDSVVDSQNNVSDNQSAPMSIDDEICVIPKQTIVFSGSYRSLIRNYTFKTLFNAGKEGDVTSAKKLAKLFITDKFINEFNSKYKNVTIIPVIGKNGTTKNIVPKYAAQYVASLTGNEYYDGIYKTSKNGLKNKSSQARLSSQLDYDFRNKGAQDIEGRHFVIFDDCITTGTTSTSLRDFIEAHGGIVDGYASIAKGIDHSDNMAITEEQFDELIKLTNNESKDKLSRLTARQAKTLLKDEKLRNILFGDNKTENDLVTDSSDNLYSFNSSYPSSEEASSDIDTSAGLQYNINAEILENHTQATYDRYGWATVNNVLSEGESKDFFSKFAQAKTGTKFVKTKDGFFIIPVGKQHGVNNVLVYAKGTIANPIIDKIIKIDLDNETEIYFVREAIYESESRAPHMALQNVIHAFEDANIQILSKQNYKSFLECKKIVRKTESNIRGTRRESIQNSDINFRRDENNDRSGNTEKRNGTSVRADNSNELNYSFSNDRNIPSRDDNDNQISRSVRTILESDATPDTFVPGVLREIREGRFSYEAITDENAEKRALDYINSRGYVDSLKSLLTQVERGSMHTQYIVL